MPSLRKTIAALYGVQIASYAAPLITLPWLTRALGPTGFGRLSFCMAVTNYFVLFADYGFNLSATRQIAVCAHDRMQRSRVFWNTIAVKALLAAMGLPCLVLLALCVRQLGEVRYLLLINYLSVIGATLTPVWYFQGIERQSTLSGITVAVRLMSIPPLFLFVHTPNDVPLAILINSAATVVCGLICLGYLMRIDHVDRARVDPGQLVAALKGGWHLFVSTASISLYQATNTVVLGLVAGSAAVGQFSAAEKIIQASQSLLVPVSQAIYPRVSRLMQESRSAAFALIRKALRLQGSAALMLSVLLFVFAPMVVQLLYGAKYMEAVSVLRWLAALPFFVGLSNVFGVQTLLAMGMNKLVTRILIAAGAINVALLLALTHWFGAIGAAISVATTEMLVTVAMAMAVIRLDLPVFRLRWQPRAAP
jgi:PST family polysaccharide transporter